LGESLEAALREKLSKAAEELPEPPDELKRFSLKTLKWFGPGAVIASLTIGSGELVWTPRAFTALGYAVAWLVFYGIWVKGVIQYLANKWYAVTGESSTHVLSRFFGTWFTIFLAIIILIVMPQWYAVLGTLSAQIIWISVFGKAANLTLIWAVVVAVTVAIVATAAWLGKSYSVLEWVMIALCAAMTILFWIAVFVAVRPDWGSFFANTLIPRPIPEYEDWALKAARDIVGVPPWWLAGTALGALGGGIQDYVGYVGMLKEKGWGILMSKLADEIKMIYYDIPRRAKVPLPEEPEKVRKLMTWVNGVKADVVISFFLVWFITMATAILSVEILRPQHLIPSGLSLVEYQAKWLAAIHPALSVMWWLGAFAGIWGTFYGLWDAYTYTIWELLRSAKRFANITTNTVRKYLWPYLIAVGSFYVLSGWSLPWLAGFAGALTHLFGLAIWGLALLYCDQKLLPKPYRAPIWYVAIVVVGALVYLVYGTLQVIQSFGISPF